MPSRVNSANTSADLGDRDDFDRPRVGIRELIERVLHGVAIVLLAGLVWFSIHALRERPEVRAAGRKVRDALALWSTRAAPEHAHVTFDSLPEPDVRDWVAKLALTGTQTSWEGATLKPTAVSVEPIADPKHPVRVWMAAPPGSPVMLRDALGAIDSVRTRTAGAVTVVPHVEGPVRATVGGASATALLRDSLTVKPVLLLGIASWEGKFILASLEEYGWKVDAHFAISPKSGDVVQGPPEPQIDTAHYSAVIALDTSASDYASEIATYVRNGGGFIAAGDAAGMADFSGILPGRPGTPLQDAEFEADSTHPRVALALAPLGGLKPGAVAIETRGKNVAVAAQRLGNGRVLQVGYSDTWRWRMGGLNNPVPLYRSWWSNMVSSIAYAPRTPLNVDTPVEPTPMVSLVSTLGKPQSIGPERSDPLNDPRLWPIAFTLLTGALFLEWASRRLRGQS